MATEKSGYLQTIDLKTLMQVAQKQNWILNLLVKPGDHLLAGDAVAEVWGCSELKTEQTKKLRKTFYLDRERTPAQDIRYQFQQLTDVVVRALSPGINNPFTAINGIDELAAALLLFIKRAPVREHRQDASGTLRFIVPTASIRELLNDTVGHIAIYGASDHFVMDALRKVLDNVVPRLEELADIEVVQHLQQTLDRRQASSKD